MAQSDQNICLYRLKRLGKVKTFLCIKGERGAGKAGRTELLVGGRAFGE